MIGIGQNTHIAFNDPPADFETEEPYIVVSLDERCKAQQVQEGWFRTIDEVPKQAVTMSVRQILRCEAILSCVPYPEKAEAAAHALERRGRPRSRLHSQNAQNFTCMPTAIALAARGTGKL